MAEPRSALVVPMHVDALYLEHDRSVLEPFADFSRLPYSTPRGDVSSEIAYLSEEILSRPFEDQGHHLRAGIHLHWALPDGLRKGASHGLQFTIDSDQATTDALDKHVLPGDLKARFAHAGYVLADDAVVQIIRPSNRWNVFEPTTHRTYTVHNASHWDPDIAGILERKRLKVHSGHVTFPVVPNRWLVRRLVHRDNPAKWEVDRRWVVESDYLHPPGSNSVPDAIAYPYVDGAHPQPFRYLGRVLPLETWLKEAKTPGSHLGTLTAIGYGEATFAAFYPNCHSVFGFYDPESATRPAPWTSVAYDVIGWYDNVDRDCIRSDAFADAIDAAVTKYSLQHATAGSDLATRQRFDDLRFEALEHKYGWTLQRKENENVAFPSRTICAGRVHVECKSFDFSDPSTASEASRTVRVAVGNTGTEAMSAYLASHLAKDAQRDKWRLEEQLEALHLQGRLEGCHHDIAQTFQDARHEQGFTQVHGGTNWTIVRRGGAGTPAPETDTAPVPLPPEITALLDRLNVEQATADHEDRDVEAMQAQLFAAWYHYVICAYPPGDALGDFPGMDEARRHVEERVLAPLQAARVATQVTRVRYARALHAVEAALAAFNATAKEPLALKNIPAPRYWRPTDPVLLLSGDAARPSERFPNPRTLTCCLTPIAVGTVESQHDGLSAAIDGLYTAGSLKPLECRQQPWNPFLLEWRVDVHPHHTDAQNPYDDPSFIEKRYWIAPDRVDLELQKPGTDMFALEGNRYTGRALLTGYAKGQLRLQLEAYLKEQLVPLYRAQMKRVPGLADSVPWQTVTVWYAEWRQTTTDKDDVIDALWSAYREVIEEEDGAHWCLTQSLTGFNDALIMRKHTMQLPVDDPLGFEEDREFTRRVGEAVGSHNRTAPQPQDGFMPIRAGRLVVKDLRLVDTFGRVQELVIPGEPTRVIAAETMATEEPSAGVCLRPRLAQPARLNFRWLADHDTRAAGTAPGTAGGAIPSIVCGWIVHNRLDQTLMIYAENGDALGLVAGKGWWQPAPGQAEPMVPRNIPGLTLRRLVGTLLACDVQEFIDRIEQNLEAIDPDASAHYQGTAFLIGRPLAVVRATVGFELRGLPSSDQSWEAFRGAIDGTTESEPTRGFTRVNFPVRIGDHGRLNDGLVALWRDEGHDTGATRGLTDAGYGSRQSVELPLSLEDSPRALVLLVDPRGVVHATSGVLPAKSIGIPHDHYVAAVKRLQATFLTGPILTPRGSVRLPLPPEPGFAWSWVEKVKREWVEVSGIEQPLLEARWGEPPEIVEGWARLTRTETREDTDDND
jgi:hypothetical protein